MKSCMAEMGSHRSRKSSGSLYLPIPSKLSQVYCECLSALRRICERDPKSLIVIKLRLIAFNDFATLRVAIA